MSTRSYNICCYTAAAAAAVAFISIFAAVVLLVIVDAAVLPLTKTMAQSTYCCCVNLFYYERAYSQFINFVHPLALYSLLCGLGSPRNKNVHLRAETQADVGLPKRSPSAYDTILQQ